MTTAVKTTVANNTVFVSGTNTEDKTITTQATTFGQFKQENPGIDFHNMSVSIVGMDGSNYSVTSDSHTLPGTNYHMVLTPSKNTSGAIKVFNNKAIDRAIEKLEKSVNEYIEYMEKNASI